MLLTIPQIIANIDSIYDESFPLLTATQKNNHALVSLLLTYPTINVNQTTKIGTSTLLTAVHNNSHQIIAELLKKPEIDMTLEDRYGNNILDIAAQLKQYSTTIAILKKKQLPFTKDKLNECFVRYIQENCFDNTVIELFCDHTDINCTDVYGNTPLMYACTFNNKQLIKYLLHKGADPYITNNVGDNILLKLISQKYYDVACMMLEICNFTSEFINKKM